MWSVWAEFVSVKLLPLFVAVAERSHVSRPVSVGPVCSPELETEAEAEAEAEAGDEDEDDGFEVEVDCANGEEVDGADDSHETDCNWYLVHCCGARGHCGQTVAGFVLDNQNQMELWGLSVAKSSDRERRWYWSDLGVMDTKVAEGVVPAHLEDADADADDDDDHCCGGGTGSSVSWSEDFRTERLMADSECS